MTTSANPRVSRATVAGGCALAVAIAVFLVLKLFALRPHPNDDGIYVYAAARILDGALPYRDFFLAHPPGHVLMTALAFLVAGGPSLAVAKSVVFACAAAQAAFVHHLVRRLAFSAAGEAVRELAAFGAAVLVLTSQTFLVASSDDTGLIQSTTLLAGAWALLANGRVRMAGAIAGAAAMTSMQVVPLVFATVVAVDVLGGRRRARRFLFACGAVVVAVHAVFIAPPGSRFVDQVYGFHFRKVARAGEGMRALQSFGASNAVLIAGALLGSLALALHGRRGRRFALLLGGAVALYSVFIATRPRVFFWYFVPVVAPLALLFGLGVAAVFAAPRRARMAASLRGWAPRAVAVLAPFLISVTWPAPVRGLKSPHGAPLETYLGVYRWADAPLLGAGNGLVRALFWQAGRRSDPGTRSNLVTEYLWRQSEWLDTHPEIVAAVRRIARRRPAVTLFGDYATVPLIAIDAGVRLAGDFADTTAQRFDARSASFEKVRAMLEEQRDPLVLLRDQGSGANAMTELHDLLADRFRPTTTFVSRGGVRHVLYERVAP